MCYTSGTTGNPKAALYSHRSTILHAYAAALPDVMCLSARDCGAAGGADVPRQRLGHSVFGRADRLPSWCFPGPALDGKSIYELIEAEKVTYAAGVPTVWQMMLGHMKPDGLQFSTLKRTVIGGSACPPAMIHAFQRRLRRRGAARLGHDRDVAAGHAVHAEEQAPGRCRKRSR